jgi:hypothetical protein
MLWPSAIALGFLVFLGAIGQGNAVKTASADDNDICLILSTANAVDGEFQMQEDETHFFAALVEKEGWSDHFGDEALDGEEEDDPNILENGESEVQVDLDDEIGDSDITSSAVPDGDDEHGNIFVYDDEIDTDILHDREVIHGHDDVGDLEDGMEAVIEDFADFWKDADGESYEGEGVGSNLCGDDDDTLQEDFADAVLAALVQCADVDDDDCNGSGDECVNCDITWENKALVLPDVAEAVAEIVFGYGTDAPYNFFVNCFNEPFHDDFEDWLFTEYAGEITHGPGVEGDEAEIDIFGAGDSEDLANSFCSSVMDYGDLGIEDEDVPEFGMDGWVIVDVTCDEAGTFELSFSIHGDDADSEAVTVNCTGEVDEGEITATPSKVEIVPAMGSVSYSLIVVSLLDEDGNPVDGPVEVDFTTDRCVFLDEDGLSEEDYLEVVNLFEEYDPNKPDTAEAIADAMDDIDNDDDSDDESNTVDSFILDDDTDDFDEGDNLAAVILDCHQEDITPGVAEVCFEVDSGGGDVDGCVKVTVVGPPAKITAAAAPASLICGEKATISFEVVDSANQPVSDHTRVEAVTNIGGVLAGTGAVAGQAGLVTPVSSTVAETFGGKGTIYLLTSDAHTGPYEVVLASGGQGSVNTGLGGVFSTPPVVVQVTVACTQPAVAAAAPTVTAPRTGTGTISPPNTGDAGLADTSSSGFSWALVAVAGVVAFSVAGLATLKTSRR